MMAQKTGRRRLEKLSKAAETAVHTRKVFVRLKLARCLKILKELTRFDEAGDLLRASARKRGIISGVAFLVLIFVLLFVAAIEELWIVSTVLCFGMVAAAALAVYSFIQYKRLKNLDLANDFRTVLVPFLTAIREDVPAQDKIKLKLDLAGPSDSKVIRKGEPASKGGKKIQETVYSDPWCHLEAPLAAGSHITLDISNVYTQRNVSWKTRGKHKRKTKWKKLVLVRAGMSPAPGRFAIDPAAADQKLGEYGLKLKKRPEGETAAIKAKRKFKSAGPAPPSESIQPKEILDMFFRLGSVMRPVSTGGQSA